MQWRGLALGFGVELATREGPTQCSAMQTQHRTPAAEREQGGLRLRVLAGPLLLPAEGCRAWRMPCGSAACVMERKVHRGQALLWSPHYKHPKGPPSINTSHSREQGDRASWGMCKHARSPATPVPQSRVDHHLKPQRPKNICQQAGLLQMAGISSLLGQKPIKWLKPPKDRLAWGIAGS